jgi:hypothetical protein
MNVLENHGRPTPSTQAGYGRTRHLLVLTAAGLLAASFAPTARALGPASPLIPPLQIFAIPTGACDGGFVTTSGGANTITAYVGQDINFVLSMQNGDSMVHDWDFSGPCAPSSTGTTVGYEPITRSWTAAGGPFIVDMINTQGSIEQQIKVVVLPETNYPVEARVTADNSYVLAFGGGGGIPSTNFKPAVFNTSAAGIFGCPSSGGTEIHTFSAPKHGYVYIAAWGDDAVTQGVLAQIKRLDGWWGPLFNKAAYSGSAPWQVFATGIDFDWGVAPSAAEINAQIEIANKNAGVPGLTSIGWVHGDATGCFNPLSDGYLVAGEANNTVPNGDDCYVSEFGKVCGIGQLAQWMWYDFDGSGSVCAFEAGGGQREFLIFRMPVSALPPAFTGWTATDAASGTPGAGIINGLGLVGGLSASTGVVPPAP